MKKHEKILDGQNQRRIIEQLAKEFGLAEETITILLNHPDGLDETKIVGLLESDEKLKTAVLINCLASDEKFAEEYVKQKGIPQRNFDINIRELVRKAEVKLKTNK